MEDWESRREPRARLEDPPASLPSEIWRKIISFTVRSSLGSRIDLEDAFEASYKEADEIADSVLLSDRKSLARVSSSWRFAVAEISAECLTIRDGKTLAAIVKAFEHSKTQKTCTGRHLGEVTRRIDVLRQFSYRNHDNTHIAQLIRLLKCTPNLLIYTHDDFPIYPETYIVTQEVLETLIIHCGRSLRRIGWKTTGKMLNYQNIVKMWNAFPDLVTLRLTSVCFMPEPSSNNLLYFQRLKTLSLSSIPRHASTKPTPWHWFVRRISLDSGQLPSLERFDCNRLPQDTMAFFRVHGHKIRQLQVSRFLENNISGALELCPKLESLVIDAPGVDYKLPLAHSTLARICIRSGISSKSLDFLLRSIEEMDAPCLKKVQLNKAAISDFIDYRLGSWWGRLDARGVRLINELGTSYDNVPLHSLAFSFHS